MDRAETAAGAVILALGGWLLAESLRFSFLLSGVPGPGFLPFWIACGIIVSGLALIAKGIRPASIVQEAIQWPGSSGWRRVGLMLAALTVSFLLLETLGFIVITTLFMAVAIFCLGERSWRILIMVPPLLALALYGVFEVWLRVPLPKGLLGID